VNVYKALSPVIDTDVTGVTLSRTELTFKKRETAELTAEVSPAEVKNKRVIWSSSDEAVATVSNIGVVKGTGEGVCTITARSEQNNTVSAECTVTVEGEIPIVEFRDLNFKQAVVDALLTLWGADDGDFNKYLYLSVNDDIFIDDAAMLTRLNLSNKNITDLAGIEYFTGLTELDCSNNGIQTLDVSALPCLTKLNCSDNYLCSLNFNGANAFTEIICNNNYLNVTPGNILREKLDLFEGIDTLLYLPQKTYAGTGSGTERDPYILQTRDDVWALTESLGDVNPYFAGAYYRLEPENGDYIDMADEPPVSIGRGFSGTLDGCGAEIRNAVSIVPDIAGGTVHDLCIRNGKLAEGIAGDAVISNIYAVDCPAIAENFYGGVIKNCFYEGKGVIAKEAGGGAVIQDCFSTGSIVKNNAGGVIENCVSVTGGAFSPRELWDKNTYSKWTFDADNWTWDDEYCYPKINARQKYPFDFYFDISYVDGIYTVYPHSHLTDLEYKTDFLPISANDDGFNAFIGPATAAAPLWHNQFFIKGMFDGEPVTGKFTRDDLLYYKDIETLKENNEITVNAEVVNGLEHGQSVLMILCVYDENNRLTGIDTDSFLLDAGGEKQISLSAPDGYSAKLLMLNGFTGLNPLTGVYEIKGGNSN